MPFFLNAEYVCPYWIQDIFSGVSFPSASANAFTVPLSLYQS